MIVNAPQMPHLDELEYTERRYREVAKVDRRRNRWTGYDVEHNNTAGPASLEAQLLADVAQLEFWAQGSHERGFTFTRDVIRRLIRAIKFARLAETDAALVRIIERGVDDAYHAAKLPEYTDDESAKIEREAQLVQEWLAQRLREVRSADS